MSANNHKQNARMQAVTRHPKATDTKLTRFVLSSSLHLPPRYQIRKRNASRSGVKIS